MTNQPAIEERVLEALAEIRTELDAIRGQAARPALAPSATVQELESIKGRMLRIDRCLLRLADQERALHEYDKHAAPEVA